MTDPLPMLARLAQTPAAPFREADVARALLLLLDGAGIPWTRDPFGNVLARVQRGTPHQALAMVAHLDHPAFEVTAADGAGATGRLLGGVRIEALPAGTPLRMMTGGWWQHASLLAADRDAPSGAVTLHIDGPASARAGDWGVWEMPDYAEDGALIRMRACDDLAGCASILAALMDAATGDWPVDLTAVFTRAEEVGLVGATLVAQQGLLPRNTMVISVESSRQLPGALQGGGPVIRVGDVRSTFHPEAEAVLQAASSSLREADPAWKAQRQLMSGGTCEATAFAQFGYRVTGLALPLGNYHNVPDAVYDSTPLPPEGPGVATEYIHRHDLGGAARLLSQATRSAADRPPDTAKARLEGLADEYRDRLQATREA